jgi:HSP20 family protein
MPGIPKENMDIKVTDSQVEISGDNVLACEIDHDDLAYLCNERSMTNFHRTVPLPKAVVPDRAEASMDNGILVIKLPKVMPKDGPVVSLRVG